MGNSVKGLAEIHHNEVELPPSLYLRGKLISKSDQLRLTGTFFPEAMLTVGEDVIIVEMAHDVRYHYMFQYLTDNACK